LNRHPVNAIQEAIIQEIKHGLRCHFCASAIRFLRVRRRGIFRLSRQSAAEVIQAISRFAAPFSGAVGSGSSTGLLHRGPALRLR
jgi:hypothetical protein